MNTRTILVILRQNVIDMHQIIMINKCLIVYLKYQRARYQRTNNSSHCYSKRLSTLLTKNVKLSRHITFSNCSINGSICWSVYRQLPNIPIFTEIYIACSKGNSDLLCSAQYVTTIISLLIKFSYYLFSFLVTTHTHFNV